MQVKRSPKKRDEKRERLVLACENTERKARGKISGIQTGEDCGLKKKAEGQSAVL